MQTTQRARTTGLGVAGASAALRGLILPTRALHRALAGARTTHGFVLIAPIMLAMLLAPFSVASAQTAAPDAGAVAQEYRDIGGRWTGASDAAVQSLAKTGGTLTNIVTGKVAGLSNAVAIADWSATLGAASALDVRGAVSGAAAIAVGGNVTAGGAALFGEIGTVAGGAVGSFFPVIGNIAGSIVGGAVGTAAGGFICAFGYDKYVKDYVAKGVTGIVSVFDTAPLTKAMEAKRAFLWATMAPEERAQLQGFNPQEVTLLDFGTLPYVLVPKTSEATQQQMNIDRGIAGGSTFTLVQNLEIGHSMVCTITDGKVSCAGQHSVSGTQFTSQFMYSSSGVVNGDTMDVQARTILEFRGTSKGGCSATEEHLAREQIVLEQGGRALTTGHFTARHLGASTCGGPAAWSGNYSLIGTWHSAK